jgi:hypothetical protein
MKKFQILFLFLMLIIFSQCNSSIEEFVVGKNFINDQTSIIKIDTLTLQTSVVKYDSIISSSAGRFLVGSNYNSFSGYKSCGTFFTMKFDDEISTTNFDYTKLVYDSLTLVLGYDSYYSGDTTVAQTIGVYRLSEKLKLRDGDNKYLYTTSKFSYDETPLGTRTFKPRPKTSKLLRIRLSDTFGKRLAEMIKDKNDTITTEDYFLKFFYGITIKPVSEANGAVLGLRIADVSTTSTSSSYKSSSSNTFTSLSYNSETGSSSAKIKPEFRLYFHLEPNPNDLRNLYYKFSFVTDGVYFNQITPNFTNSLMEGIEDTDDERSSTLTENHIIIQSGVHVFTKIKIPYIYNLLKISDSPAVAGAVLKLYPIKGTYSSTSELPDSLYIYKANKNNALIGQITVPGSTSKYVYGRLYTDSSDPDYEAYYEADVSSFIESELAAESETVDCLFIGYGSTAAKKTAGHVILGGVNSGIYAPDLSVFYYHD